MKQNSSSNIIPLQIRQQGTYYLDNIKIYSVANDTIINKNEVVDGYRYGFNGMERDDAVKGRGNSYTTQFRQYDPRVGRWLTIDPKRNAFESPYIGFSDNPIMYSDPMGDTIVWKNKNGNTLMKLDNGKKSNIIKTTKEIYKMGIQWFEPKANNYMKPLWTNPNIAQMKGIKHFSWNDILNFANSHRNLSGYAYNGAPNDWKENLKGADGYYLSTVGGKLYWSDAIGQIPYAINQIRSDLLSGKTRKEALIHTIKMGEIFGGGLFGESDKTNSYDNFMILRGAIFALKRFIPIKVTNSTKIKLNINYNISSKYLEKSVSVMESGYNSQYDYSHSDKP